MTMSSNSSAILSHHYIIPKIAQYMTINCVYFAQHRHAYGAVQIAEEGFVQLKDIPSI